MCIRDSYFSSWEGIQDDGKIKCEWVVSFYLDNNYDNTARLYVTSVMSSEDYGLKQYYAKQGVDSGGDTEVTSNSNKDQLANYSIKDNSLLVTYDGEKYVSVPVSYSYSYLRFIFSDYSTPGNSQFSLLYLIFPVIANLTPGIVPALLRFCKCLAKIL